MCGAGPGLGNWAWATCLKPPGCACGETASDLQMDEILEIDSALNERSKGRWVLSGSFSLIGRLDLIGMWFAEDQRETII